MPRINLLPSRSLLQRLGDFLSMILPPGMVASATGARFGPESLRGHTVWPERPGWRETDNSLEGIRNRIMYGGHRVLEKWDGGDRLARRRRERIDPYMGWVDRSV